MKLRYWLSIVVFVMILGYFSTQTVSASVQSPGRDTIIKQKIGNSTVVLPIRISCLYDEATSPVNGTVMEFSYSSKKPEYATYTGALPTTLRFSFVYGMDEIDKKIKIYTRKTKNTDLKLSDVCDFNIQVKIMYSTTDGGYHVIGNKKAIKTYGKNQNQYIDIPIVSIARPIAYNKKDIIKVQIIWWLRDKKTKHTKTIKLHASDTMEFFRTEE